MTQQETIEFIKCARDPVYFMNTYGYIFDITKNNIDRLHLFEYQKDVLKNYRENKNNIILKARQCVPEETFIDTPFGPKQISFLKKGDLVYSYNFQKNIVEEDVISEHWCSGKKQCVNVKLKDSRNIEVGENHPFYSETNKKWTLAKDLEKYNRVLQGKIEFGNIAVDDSCAIMLGYLITDGCTIKQVKFTNNNLNYLLEFEKCVNDVFPELEIRKEPKCNGFDYAPHQKHGVSTKNPIMKWCEEYGICKKSEYKILPETVFGWNKNSLSILINRIFAGDGWVSMNRDFRKKNFTEKIELGLGSPCLEFLHQIKFLLKKFGINSNIYEVKNMKLQKNRFFKLRITHSISVEIFINEIGIYGKINENHIKKINNKKHKVKHEPYVQIVVPTSVKNCYDITVEKNQNFLINGVVVHNTGISVITSGYVCWKMLFHENERIMIVANDGAGARRFLSSVKQFLDYLPKFLLPDVIPTNNTQQIVVSNGSWCKAVASGGNAGRGETLTLLILDETAFIENADDIWMASGLALSSKDAKCIMISTPNGTSGLFHSTWTGSLKKENNFFGTEVHWSQHSYYARGLEERTDEHGRKYMWSPWYEQQCELMKYDRVKIAQELDLSFEGSSAVVIENWILEKYEKDIQTQNIKPVCYYDYKEAGYKFVDRETNFYVWEKPQPKANYIIGGDVARGDSADFSTLQVINADTLVQVAEYQGKIYPDIFADLVHKVAMDYNMAYVAIEGNNHGLVTTLALKNVLKYPADKIHHSKSIKKIYVRYGNVDHFDQDAEIPGFQTTPKTRPLIMNCVAKYMRDGQIKIYSKRLLSEFKTFIHNGDRPEHAPGYHDDLIFAFAIALFMRDTEFDNVFKSKEFFKAMLDSISYSSNSKGIPTNTQKEEKRNIQNPNDLGWLYGPISG